MNNAGPQLPDGTGLASYRVWDAPTRGFHWINAICVLLLAALGLILLNASALDVSSSGKILLKTLHVWTGYVFALNIVIRIAWGFFGNHHARWRQMLPVGRDYFRRLRRYLASIAEGSPEPYIGHNPLGRIAISGLLLIMIVQASTGLLLAGTDIYFPPFGAWIAEWIAAPGVDPATLVPYSPEMYDEAAYAEMRSLRKPFFVVHLYGFYLLAAGTVIHIAGVVITETREGGSLTSAMISGRKALSGRPADAPESAVAAEKHA
ncbi:cytochrome b/b6 domain-containing protein [Chromatocurvus halotolerans]|uniref:Cytochrome b n=1 Tax=Chromatocurvus halotolerans TaxID=1132028 RepID=A0A4R2KLZ6_9GAMM|nr:cytochrome b/b6 domain-containing protein [Chromatocurvus halotolerans]TCO74713.1 cytochrome b [Chromatocurvus halotolerans]